MKIISSNLLDNVSAQAAANQRLRMNYNLHDDTNEPVNRLLNAMEPGTYIRPHRHTDPPKHEGIIVLRGEIAVYTFNDNGEILQQCILNPDKGMYGIDLMPHEWHSFLVLQTGTVVYEVKTGPYVPIAETDWGAWSPEPSDQQAVNEYMMMLKSKLG